MSLNFYKKEKLLAGAIDKGYHRDPEGYPLDFLMLRLNEEHGETEIALHHLDEAMKGFILWGKDPDNIGIPSITEYNQFKTEALKELADLSNLVDFIASKIIMDYEDKYANELDPGV